MTERTPRWADHKTVCEYLHVKPSTLYRYAADGILTRHTIGGSVRYDLNQADDVLRRNGEALPLRQPDFDPAADVIARIRAALPQGTGRPLIPLTQVHAAIDKVAADLGIDGPTS